MTSFVHVCTVLKAGYKSVLLDNDASEEVKAGSDERNLISRDACNRRLLTGGLEEPHGWVPKHGLSLLFFLFSSAGVEQLHKQLDANFPQDSLGSPSQHVQKVVLKVCFTVAIFC